MADFKNKTSEYGKINFDFLLMTHIQDINKQLAKLPHESVMANVSEPIGTTYDDIIRSYCDMVQQLDKLLKPYHDEEYKKSEIKEKTEFKKENERFGFLMELCHRKGFLFTKIKTKATAEDVNE